MIQFNPSSELVSHIMRGARKFHPEANVGEDEARMALCTKLGRFFVTLVDSLSNSGETFALTKNKKFNQIFIDCMEIRINIDEPIKFYELLFKELKPLAEKKSLKTREGVLILNREGELELMKC